MAESKIRVKHTQPFTTVFNSVLRDQRLSLKTLGLYVIMQSFPDDWEYSISGLAARCRIGRDAIRKCLKELEEAGYLLKEQGHQENGKFACNTYVLQDEAPPCTEKPYTVKPSTVKPLTENQPQVKKHLSKDYSNDPPIWAVIEQASDRIANQSTHIAALQQEIEKLRGQNKQLREAAALVTKESAELLERQWIPVEERLPEVWRNDETAELVNYMIYSPDFGVDIGNYHAKAKKWLCMALPCTVTHWAPLPEPPEVE